MEYRQHLQRIDRVIEALRSRNRNNELEACTLFAKLFSIVQVFPTPLERRAVADDVVAIFEITIKQNLTPLFVRYLQEANDHPLLQVHNCIF
jgi:hypothetical protein